MKAVYARLTRAGNVWDQQVGEVIQPRWSKPYCQVYWVAGGEDNFLKAQDATIDLAVKCIADTQDDSFTGAAQISAALNDMGEQDDTADPLDGGDDWVITTSTQMRIIHTVEQFAKAENIYHDGHVFSFVMGRRAS